MSRINLVNIRQGTKSEHRFSHGNALPLVQRPFGMNALTLQTEKNGGWFYQPDAKCLEGIRLTHQPSPWVNDYGTFLMTPQNDVIADSSEAAWSGYRPKEAILTPSYIKVRFLRSMCDFEAVPTERGAVCRLTFLKDCKSCLSLLPVKGNYTYKLLPEKNEIIGTTTGHSYDIAENFKMFFVLRFKEGDVDFDATTLKGQNDTEEAALHIYLNHAVVEYSLATSYISAELAEEAIRREINGRSLEDIHAENDVIWEEHLGRIDAEFDSEKVERTFYTCLWRTFLYPHKGYEIDQAGNIVHYVPADGSVHAGVRYTGNGFWDTYRTVYPLFAMIAPKEYAEMLEAYVNEYLDGGWLPRWLGIGELGCMPSTLIDAVIAHAVVNGIGDYKLWQTALEGMLKHANQAAPLPRFGRNGVEAYCKYGYVPREDYKESVNLTLDAAYGDWCIAVVAETLGRKDLLKEYQLRAKNYRNLFDSETGFMRGRDKNGTMDIDFDPCKWGGEYTEAAAWQTSFSVPHDLEGLAELMGGRDALLAKLDELFATPPVYRVGACNREIHEMTEFAALDYGQCAINNQPSFHIPYIYAYFGEIEKARYWVHKMALEAFSDEPDGFPGDEDNGSMAAWYVFACLGKYPLCPGKRQLVEIPGLARSYTIRSI